LDIHHFELADNAYNKKIRQLIMLHFIPNLSKSIHTIN
jgi:hypothetical protein